MGQANETMGFSPLRLSFVNNGLKPIVSCHGATMTFTRFGCLMISSASCM